MLRGFGLIHFMDPPSIVQAGNRYEEDLALGRNLLSPCLWIRRYMVERATVFPTESS